MRQGNLVGVVLVLLAAGGCKGLEAGAKATFSREYTCPEDQVTATERADFDAAAATFGPIPAPPAEVAGDAARLALWQDGRAKERGAFNALGVVFEVRGCEHEALYLCTHPNTGSGRTNLAQVGCSALPRARAAGP